MNLKTHLKNLGKAAYRWWLAFAHALGYVNTKILLSVFYLAVLGPVWLICAILRIDFLDRRLGGTATYWREKTPVDHSRTSARHQF